MARASLRTVRLTSIMSPTGSTPIAEPTFSIDDYDAVGFDLDHTLARYKLGNLYKLVYDAVVAHLKIKGYSGAQLGSYTEGIRFWQKGLLVDKLRGNVLKLDHRRTIVQGYHGHRQLSADELNEHYGPSRTCDAFNCFPHIRGTPTKTDVSNFIAFSDYFTVSTEHLYVNLIDLVESHGTHDYAKAWADMYSGFVAMYRRDAFQDNTGFFFPTVKERPHDIVHRCSDNVLSWIRKLRATGKKTFLLSSSNADFVEVLANESMGPNWRSYFDIVLTYARKPGFFMKRRPSYVVADGYREGEEVTGILAPGGLYSQGNWMQLKQFLVDSTGKENLRVVYIGDSITDDVMAPALYGCCDTVAVVEELGAELGVCGTLPSHEAEACLASHIWGSFFGDGSPSMWTDAIQKTARVAVPSLEYLASLPCGGRIEAFNGASFVRGFHPSKPGCLSKL